MQNRTNPVRRHTRFPVSWPMVYGNDAFVAEGTVLDLTTLGWRVAGAMPVTPGMQLTLQVSVPERSTRLCVHRATVLWVQAHEFAVEAHEMAPIDQAWVTEFLQERLGLRWMPQPTNQSRSPRVLGKPAPCERAVPPPAVPCVEDILQRLLEIGTAIDHAPEQRWNEDANSRSGKNRRSDDCMPGKILCEARRIARCMVAIKSDRARSGRNPMLNN
jgi:hypothetical protein